MSGLFLYLFFGNTMLILMEFLLMYTLCTGFTEFTASRRKVVLVFLFVSPLIGFLSTMFTLVQIQENSFFFMSYGMIFYFIVVNIMQAVVLKGLIKTMNGTFIFLNVTLISALADLCTNTTEVLEIYSEAFDRAATYLSKFLLRVPFIVITFVLIYGLIRFLPKSRGFDVLKVMINYPRACVFIAFTMVASKVMSLRFYGNAVALFGNAYHSTLYFLFFAAIIIMVVLLVHSYVSDVKRNELGIALTQQTDYLRRLEEIQKKLRIINHDYKNVAAGLYLKASDGDVEAVKSYVAEQLLKIDQDIQMEVRQVNQLINIKDVELKGLLITKIALATEKSATVDLEICDAVSNINMPARDLLRSLGILIDNAIEGAESVSDRIIKIIITINDDIVTVLIMNRYEGEVSLRQIFAEGYSSKGGSRGLGLYSLKKILAKYPHVFLETRLDEGWFVQLLKII